MAGRSRAHGIRLTLVCLAILGVMPLIAERRPDGLTALGFALLLSAWQLACSLPGYLGERRRPRGTAPEVPAAHGRLQRASVLGLMLGTGGIFGLATFLYVFAAEKAGAVSFSIALQAYPLFAILWESVFLRRRKTAIELAFTAIVVAAMVFLGTEGTWRLDAGSRWVLVAICVPFLWSVAHVALREVVAAERVTPKQVVFSRVLISTIVLGIAFVVADGPRALIDVVADPRFQLIGAVMGALYYYELLIWFYAVRHIDVSLASSITAPAPVATMIMSVLFLGEPVATYQAVALSMVVLGIVGLIATGRSPRPVGAAREVTSPPTA